MKSTLVLLAAATLAHAASPAPQLYFAPSSLSSSSAPSTHNAPPLTPQQANAALAHLLSVSHHTQLPISRGKNGREWEKVLEEQVDANQPRVVLALECGKYGCDDALPPSLASTPSHYALPSLPLHSYLSTLSLHLHRFASSLGLDLDAVEHTDAVVGLKEFVEEGIKGVAGWQGWISEELGSWIGWNDIKKKVKAAVEPELPQTGIFGDLDMLDSSAALLVQELEKLTLLADSFSPSSRSYNADGSVDASSQGQGQPQIVVVHLKGLKKLSDSHSPSSPVYTHTLTLLRQTLSAFCSSISAQTHSSARFVVLTLPPHPTPLLRRKEPWMKPFEVRGVKYGASASEAAKRNLNGNVKRSVFSPSADAGRVGKRQSSGDDGEDGNEDWSKHAPIVPSSHLCFSSAADATNQTASCLGRGQVVRGLSTRLNEGEECWVCKCGSTTEEREDGRTVKRNWRGQGCEKEDLSSPFTLLLSSSLLLLAVLGLSVALLYKVGAQDLPGTLGGAGGGAAGGHAKRD